MVPRMTDVSRAAWVEDVRKWKDRHQRHEPMCGCDHEQNDPWCAVGAINILLAHIATLEAEQDGAQRSIVDVAGDLICEAHPWLEWPHDDCAGPGMPMRNALDLLAQARREVEAAKALTESWKVHANAVQGNLELHAKEITGLRKERDRLAEGIAHHVCRSDALWCPEHRLYHGRGDVGPVPLCALLAPPNPRATEERNG